MSGQSRARLVAQIVGAFVGANDTPAADLARLIAVVDAGLGGAVRAAAERPVAVPLERRVPAAPIAASVSDRFLICLEDGRRFRSLKRHLRVVYNLSPEEYRARWGLPDSYPMVAPGYAASRSALAKAIGLGRSHSAPAAVVWDGGDRVRVA